MFTENFRSRTLDELIIRIVLNWIKRYFTVVYTAAGRIIVVCALTCLFNSPINFFELHQSKFAFSHRGNDRACITQLVLTGITFENVFLTLSTFFFVVFPAFITTVTW